MLTAEAISSGAKCSDPLVFQGLDDLVKDRTGFLRAVVGEPFHEIPACGILRHHIRTVQVVRSGTRTYLWRHGCRWSGIAIKVVGSDGLVDMRKLIQRETSALP